MAWLHRVGLGAALLAMAQNACTWKSTLEPTNVPTFANARTTAGVLEVVDRDGRTVQLDPSTTVRFVRWDGASTDEYPVGDLCRNQVGIYAGEGDCSGAQLVTSWQDIANVEIEGFDAAVTTVIVAVVVVVVVALLAGKGGGGSGHGSSGSGSGHGGGHHGGGGYHTEGAHGGRVVIVPRIGVGADVQVGPVVDGSAAPTQPLFTEPTPFFSAAERRRSNIAFVFGMEGGTCIYGPTNCSTGSLHAGIRVLDYIELLAGLRSMWGWGLSDGVSRWTPMGGAALHGAFPRFRQLAFYFGLEAGASDSLPFVFVMRPGLRFSPIPQLSITLFPFSPTYIDGPVGRPSGWQAPTSLEISTAL